MILPACGSDRRRAFPRQHRSEQRAADIEVAEIQGSGHVHVALKDGAIRISTEHQCESALDGDAIEVADGYLAAFLGLHRHPEAFRRQACQRDRPTDHHCPPSHIRAQRIDVDTIAVEDQRAGDVVDELRKAGKTDLRFLQFRRSRQPRIREGPSHTAGDADVAISTQIGNEELQQHRLESSAQIDLQSLGPGDLHESCYRESRFSLPQRELKVIEDHASVSQRSTQRPHRNERGGRDAEVELRERRVDTDRLDG